MADVSRDRAQLMVVGAIALAVALVAVGLVLNFSIYTENLATREGNSGAASVVHEQQAAVDGVGRAIEYVNSHYAAKTDRNRDQINDTLQGHVARMNDSFARIGAVTGASLQITSVEPYIGARLTDQDRSSVFTSSGSAEDWQLVTGADEVSRFTMRVRRPSLADTSLSLINMFHVKVTNKTGATWKTYIYRDSATGAAYLTTEDPNDLLGGLSDIVYTCKTFRENFTVDFVAGTFGSTDCGELQYFANDSDNDFDEPYVIEYSDGDQIGGTYEILINSSNYDATNFYDPSQGKSPYAHNATFSADVKFEYVGNDIKYRDSKRIRPLPNVTKFTGLTPEILQFRVSTDQNDDTGTDATFDVSWHVRDRDQDLKEVNVTLVDEDNSEVDDYTAYTSPPADEASGSTTLTGSGSSMYGVRIIATDSNGNVVVRTVKRNDK